MASRSKTTFQKRQKERARIDKRRDKAERREQRKTEKDTHGEGPPIAPIDPADLGLPPLEEPGEGQSAPL